MIIAFLFHLNSYSFLLNFTKVPDHNTSKNLKRTIWKGLLLSELNSNFTLVIPVFKLVFRSKVYSNRFPMTQKDLKSFRWWAILIKYYFTMLVKGRDHVSVGNKPSPQSLAHITKRWLQNSIVVNFSNTWRQYYNLCDTVLVFL